MFLRIVFTGNEITMKPLFEQIIIYISIKPISKSRDTWATMHQSFKMFSELFMFLVLYKMIEIMYLFFFYHNNKENK